MELKGEARLDVIRLLFDKYPRAIAMATSKGMLPIHCAVANGKVTKEVLQFLKDVCPSGLTAILPNGNALFHSALDASTISEAAVKWRVKYQ
jgi:hypothetical protein